MVRRGEVGDEADPTGEEAVYHTDRNDLLPQLLKSVGNVILINDKEARVALYNGLLGSRCWNLKAET
jgi:hypothetical protein